MTEEIAFIAGASRGLGLGLARELLQRSWSVIATERPNRHSPGLAELARMQPARLRIETLDINEPASVEHAKTRIGDHALDLLFVNAGVSQRTALEHLSRDDFVAALITNAYSPVQLAIALKDKVKDRGTIAFMTSRMGSITEMDAGSDAAYRASKAALNALSRCFFAELCGRGLGVLSFHPGWVRTDMGGPQALVSIEDSARGIVDIIAFEQGSAGHRFVDYQGKTIPW
ncbi:MAG: SDR family NAD(P)-dependent oxidoreductase [Alphaproteobacteria bacterium]|nr:SDR family NAD(P)-dependent oxidoreductase [Alphaproteobacteria bacterium]